MKRYSLVIVSILALQFSELFCPAQPQQVRDISSLLSEGLTVEEDGFVLNVSNQNLESLDGLQQVPAIAEVLVIQANNNNLTQLTQNALGSVPNLVILDLSFNQLTDLEDNIFQPTPNLQDINLSHNALSTLPASLFDLTSVFTLNLVGNPLPPALIAQVQDVFANVPVLMLPEQTDLIPANDLAQNKLKNLKTKLTASNSKVAQKSVKSTKHTKPAKNTRKTKTVNA